MLFPRRPCITKIAICVCSVALNATNHFRGQPLSTLTVEMLVNQESDPSLYAQTVPAKLGQVHAFMSHSWSDDGRLKHEKLHEWARELGGDDDKLVWLDKSCINQLNIDAKNAFAELSNIPPNLKRFKWTQRTSGSSSISSMILLGMAYVTVASGSGRKKD